MITDGPTTLVQNTLTLIGSAVVLLVLDWRLALATLTVFPAMAVADGDLQALLGPRLPAHPRAHGRGHREPAGGHLRRAGRAGLPARGRELPPLPQVNDGYRAANVQTVNAASIYFPFVSLLSATATAVVLGYGGVLVFRGQLSPGALFAFIGLLSNFFDPVQQLSQFYQTLLAATAALDKVVEVLATEPAMSDPRRRAAAGDRRPGRARRRPLRLLHHRHRGAARRLHSRPSPARRSPLSGTPAPASRRW